MKREGITRRAGRPLAALPLTLLAAAAGWAAQSTTFLQIPLGHFPTALSTAAFAGTDDVMQCVDWIEKVGIDDATSIEIEVSGAAGTSSSLTIYSSGGAAVIATTGVQNWSSTGVKTITGLTAFDLVAGTQYRMCWCRDGTGGTLRSATNATLTVIGGWHNALATHMGTAANTCTTGSAPSSTGSLSSANSQIPLVTVATNTP